MNPDPLSTNDRPMSYRDAAIVATVLMIATAFTVYMPLHGYDVYVRDPDRFMFDLVVYLGSLWITVFMSLTGLTAYAKRQASSEGSGGW